MKTGYKVLVSLAERMARVGNGSISVFYTYQPKRPTEMQKKEKK